MAYQLSTLVTKVQQKIRNTNYPASEITDYINDTQNDACNEYPLPFMEATQTYTVTAGNSDITDGVGLPANYVQAIDLISTATGLERVIPYRAVTASDETDPDQDDQPRGYPQYWYTYADTIRLYPEPAAAYTLTLRYYKKPTELTDDADVPEIPSEFGELLVSGAATRVFQAKDMYDIAGIHQNKYDEILQKMVAKYSQPQTGQVHIMPVNVRPITGNF